jgi:hypothetical protein
VLGDVNRIGLYAVRLEARRVGTRLAEGLFTGLASGLGASTTQKLELAPSIVLLAGNAGSIIGSAKEKEIERFGWQRDGSGGRYLVGQPADAAPVLGWQPL